MLVDFWTLTCINWLRTEPYVRAWSRAYRDDGLVVIGVHTPEFSFEHEIYRVRQATRDRSIDYAVAVDNDYAIWTAFDNHYWPALYFIDRDGLIRDQHFGEGRYEESERIIQRLLGIDRAPVPVTGTGVEAEADWNHLRTPETYLGYLRGENFASPRPDALGQAGTYEVPERLGPTSGASPASGRSGERASSFSRPAAASHSGSARVTPTWCSRRRRRHLNRFRSACSSTASRPARHTERTPMRMGAGSFATAASTSSSGRHGGVRDRTLEISFRQAGAEAYVFTFG